MKRFSKHIFLGLSIVTMIIAFLFYFNFEKGEVGAFDKTYLSTVKNRVADERAVSQKELGTIAEKLTRANQFSFNELDIITKYPYYIFRDGQLLFWSDHRFVPDYEKISQIQKEAFIDFEQGQYIISRRQIIIGNRNFDIFSAVNLYQRFRNENNYLQSKYNSSIFTTDPTNISAKVGEAYQSVQDDGNRFMFSVQPPQIEIFRNQNLPISTIFLSIFAVLFLGIYVFLWIKHFNNKRQFETAFFILAAYLLIVRWGMLYLNVPNILTETDLFNPKFYSASNINPTLGDLLLNGLVILILSLFLVDCYYRTKTYFLFTRSNKISKTIISLVAVVLSYWVFYAYIYTVSSIYEKSSYTLYITLSISFSNIKIACLAIFIFASSVYFLLTHLLSNLFVRFTQNRYVFHLSIFIIGSVMSLIGIWLFDGGIFNWVFLAHTAYFLFLLFARFPRILYTFKYRTSIYYFLAALFCALVCTYIIHEQEDQKDLYLKKDFGNRLIPENDRFGEFYLDRTNESIRQDTDIQKKFIEAPPFLRTEIQERVSSIHFDMYFDKYDIEILSFDVAGNPIDDSTASENFDNYALEYRQPQYATSYPNIYFVNDTINNFGKEYISLIDVKKDSMLLGHVILNLKLKKEYPKSVYPEFLMDKRLIQDPETRQYSYAVYDANKKLIYSNGNYNYERKMPLSVLKDTLLYSSGLSLNDYKHVGERGRNGRQAVISSKDYSWKSLMSNFAFLYLILILYIIVIIVIYAINYGFSKLKVNYTTKVQILLNVAFFLPLSLVVIIMLSVISSNYIDSQETNYLTNTKNVSTNALPYIEQVMNGQRSDGALQQELVKIGNDADLDINLFNTNGQLFSTTRREIYEYGLLSNRLNPEAYKHLLEDKENEVLLNESLGNNEYRTAYVAVKSSNGKQMGVLAVPYFDSKPELDQQILEVISSVLSVFAIMFLLFLILSYWASNILTVPLRLLTQKIRKINLYQLNQPLEWKSDDEIGSMIGAYNEMLHKLEDSKQELANTEKVTAWREMAKQVAHEIKNPLTPMKLKIQHMKRTMSSGEPPQKGRIDQFFDTLIDQIDNISDIATSFSDFAKMPLPKNELFEITAVLDKAAALYADDEKVVFRREIQNGPINIMGDRQLTGRIITNLIINGIQSVPSYRRPEITLTLHTDDGKVYIEVKDNGAGIPKNIRNKVFLPNHTTKEGGSGLGLAIAKRGVEHASGTIWYETEENEGTSFFISLPIVQN